MAAKLTHLLSVIAFTVVLSAATAPSLCFFYANAANATTSSPAAAENATQCDEELLFQKLYVLMPAINQCAKEADYYVNTDALTVPTDESLAKFCKSENCTKLSVELDDAGLPSCTVVVGTTNMSFKEFFNQMKAYCTTTTKSTDSGADSVVLAANGWKVVFATLVVMVFTSSFYL